jgi:hypothetical protein
MTDMNADHDAVDAQHTASTEPVTDAERHETDHASLADLDDPGHLFDQTNGLADGLNGDSDGTAEADEASAADRNDTDGVNPGTDAGTGRIAFNPDDRI